MDLPHGLERGEVNHCIDGVPLEHPDQSRLVTDVNLLEHRRDWQQLAQARQRLG